MGLWRETETARAAVFFCWRKHGLEMLAFIFGCARIAESGDVRMLQQHSEKWGSATTMKAADKDEFVLIWKRFQCLKWIF